MLKPGELDLSDVQNFAEDVPHEYFKMLRRVAGASVVLVDGDLALYLERGGHILSFPGADPSREPERMRLAASALAQSRGRRRRSLRISQIDGAPAARSTLLEAFAAAGFRPDYKGIVLERSETRSH